MDDIFKIMPFKIILQHFFHSRYSHFKLPATIWDAILQMAAFWEVDFGRLLICYLASPILPESIEKYFLAFFGGLNISLCLTHLVIKIYFVLFFVVGCPSEKVTFCSSEVSFNETKLTLICLLVTKYCFIFK